MVKNTKGILLGLSFQAGFEGGLLELLGHKRISFNNTLTKYFGELEISNGEVINHPIYNYAKKLIGKDWENKTHIIDYKGYGEEFFETLVDYVIKKQEYYTNKFQKEEYLRNINDELLSKCFRFYNSGVGLAKLLHLHFKKELSIKDLKILIEPMIEDYKQPDFVILNDNNIIGVGDLKTITRDFLGLNEEGMFNYDYSGFINTDEHSLDLIIQRFEDIKKLSYSNFVKICNILTKLFKILNYAKILYEKEYVNPAHPLNVYWIVPGLIFYYDFKNQDDLDNFYYSLEDIIKLAREKLLKDEYFDASEEFKSFAGRERFLEWITSGDAYIKGNHLIHGKKGNKKKLFLGRRRVNNNDRKKDDNMGYYLIKHPSKTSHSNKYIKTLVFKRELHEKIFSELLKNENLQIIINASGQGAGKNTTLVNFARECDPILLFTPRKRIINDFAGKFKEREVEVIYATKIQEQEKENGAFYINIKELKRAKDKLKKVTEELYKKLKKGGSNVKKAVAITSQTLPYIIKDERLLRDIFKTYKLIIIDEFFNSTDDFVISCCELILQLNDYYVSTTKLEKNNGLNFNKPKLVFLDASITDLKKFYDILKDWEEKIKNNEKAFCHPTTSYIVENESKKEVKVYFENGKTYINNIVPEYLDTVDFNITIPKFEVCNYTKDKVELELYCGKLFNLNLAMFKLDFELPLRIHLFGPILLTEKNIVKQIKQLIREINKKFDMLNRSGKIPKDFITALKDGEVVIFCDNKSFCEILEEMLKEFLKECGVKVPDNHIMLIHSNIKVDDLKDWDCRNKVIIGTSSISLGVSLETQKYLIILPNSFKSFYYKNNKNIENIRQVIKRLRGKFSKNTKYFDVVRDVFFFDVMQVNENMIKDEMFKRSVLSRMWEFYYQIKNVILNHKYKVTPQIIYCEGYFPDVKQIQLNKKTEKSFLDHHNDYKELYTLFLKFGYKPIYKLHVYAGDLGAVPCNWIITLPPLSLFKIDSNSTAKITFNVSNCPTEILEKVLKEAKKKYIKYEVEETITEYPMTGGIATLDAGLKSEGVSLKDLKPEDFKRITGKKLTGALSVKLLKCNDNFYLFLLNKEGILKKVKKSELIELLHSKKHPLLEFEFTNTFFDIVNVVIRRDDDVTIENTWGILVIHPLIHNPRLKELREEILLKKYIKKRVIPIPTLERLLG